MFTLLLTTAEKRLLEQKALNKQLREEEKEAQRIEELYQEFRNNFIRNLRNNA